jgi:hypothetical protein
LSRKGPKSQTRAGGLRSKTTKARTHVDRLREPRAELEKKLEARTRELSEAREQQAATAEVLQNAERLMTLSTSAVAVCCWRDSRSSLNRRLPAGQPHRSACQVESASTSLRSRKTKPPSRYRFPKTEQHAVSHHRRDFDLENLYRVPEIVTLGRFPGGGESDSRWRTKEVRHVGSDTLTPGF